MYAWSISTGIGPDGGINVMCLDQMQLAGEGDTRIMSFDIRPGFPIYITMAFSNGKVREVDYIPGTGPGAGRYVYPSCPEYKAFSSTSQTEDSRGSNWSIVSFHEGRSSMDHCA